MNKEVANKAFEAAEKELEEVKIKQLKELVKKTLEKVKSIEDEIDDLQDKKKILKLDLDDLKEGRLDRIEERQKNDPKAKSVSVVIVTKEVHHHHYDRWHEPYKITWLDLTAYPNTYPVIYGTSNYNTMCTQASKAVPSNEFTINASTAKNYSIGTYNVGSNVVHFR